MSVIPAVPRLHLLSNGNYHVMLTSAGAGYSRWKNLAVRRWREDATCDKWGSFCYIRDLAAGDVWSSTRQPTLRHADSDEATFTAGLADFQSSLYGIQTQTEIVVSPHDDVEVRRVRLTNRSSVRRLLAVTSYAEVVLAPAATDAAHQAFSKLFVETDILRGQQAILCSRRPRAPDEPRPWLFHRRTLYHITVSRMPGAAGLASLTLDGTALPGPVMPLHDDGREHRVDVQWHGPAPGEVAK